MDRILNNIIIDSKGCWIWQKSCAGSGYGQLTVKGKYWQAHRYAHTYTKGVIPKGLLLRHSCHNPKCCNPDHLSVGNDLDNWHDSKEVHLEAQVKLRKSWTIGHVTYATLREASQATGLHQGTILKHTVNGVFNVSTYKAACIQARVKPKL